jgi:raffinose/stachyose/melibiose transport system substrate-binding protein
MAPTLYIQFAANSFTGDDVNKLGFFPMPNSYAKGTAVYDLTIPCSFALNAASKYPDEAAKVMDIMMSASFSSKMTETWPGYWAVPLRDTGIINTANMKGMSAKFMEIINMVTPDIAVGHFGYHPSAFFPPVTQDAWRNIDEVWQGVMTPAEFLKAVDTAFVKEFAEGMVAPAAKPSL